ncbi:MAG: alpha/beta fold hydrolase [Pseudomonadota bacterium]
MPNAASTQKVEFPGSSGERLAAALETPAGPTRAVALFAHCFSCSKDIKAAREIARSLSRMGVAVLRFDFTGLGASEGDFANTNFSSNVDDLIKAADYLRAEHQAPSLIIGHSLGGAAVLVAATRIPEIKGVVTIGAPAEADHVVKQLGEKRAEIAATGQAIVELAGRPFTIKKQFLDDLDNERVLTAAAALKMPLLIMHAPRDETVGIDNATKIFIAAKHPKSFTSLDTADHLLSKTKDAQYAASVLCAWASRYIDGAQASSAPQDSAVSAVAPFKAAAFKDGAKAQSIASEPLAIAVSIDGYPLIIDAAKSEGGGDLGPNPTRTVEAALAACAAITARMYARRKKWPLQGISVSVRRAEGADAHVALALEKTVTLDGPLDAEQRARILEIADKCPVHRMLSEGVSITSSLL